MTITQPCWNSLNGALHRRFDHIGFREALPLSTVDRRSDAAPETS
jgi:hypothetical protein